jgi:hypothetical protein
MCFCGTGRDTSMLQLRIALPFSRAKNVFTATRKCALI